MLVEGFLLFALFFVAWQFLQLQWARRQLPPGPVPLPILGNLWLLDFALKREPLMKLTSIYGNIYTIWLGTAPVVVLNGCKAVKEGLVTYSEETSGRPLLPLFTDLMGEKGVFMTSGPVWKQQKRFVMLTLRNLGVGKKSLENRIQEEAQNLLKVFTSKKGSPFDPRTAIGHAVANIICSFVFGQRFPEEDAHLNKLLKTIHMIVYVPGSVWGRVYDSFPTIMRKFPGPYQQLFEHNEFMHNFVKDKIQSHKERWKEGSEPQDLIDFYLDFIAKARRRLLHSGSHEKAPALRPFSPIFHLQSKDDSTSVSREDNMVQTIVDLLIGGAETSTITLYWGLLYLLKYPDVQEKVHHEIDAILGPSQTITYEDRNRLPYTNAVLHEIVRYSNITITGPLRKCLKDFDMLGFPIRKYQLPPGVKDISFGEITGTTHQPFPYNLCAFPR
ncbi:hypothetical protein Chor_014537 [Crotalus horridus]